MKHSRFGGSKAEQFIACPASPQLAALVAPEEDADEPDYRRDGIAAHLVAAHCLKEDKDAWEFIGDPRLPLFGKEHVPAVQSYLDFVREASGGQPLMVEQYVDDPNFKEFGGTLDVAWLEGTVATIVDYKHGAGLSVEPNCAQLFYYGYGLLLKFPDLTTLKLIIVQPRAWHADGPIREYVATREELIDWATTVLHPAIMEAQDEGARFVPGPHCRFCPVKSACPALMGMARAVADGPAIGAYSPSDMTDEQLAAEGALVKPAEMYFRAIMSEITRRTFSGRPIAGFKAVAKKADRVWSDPVQAEAALAGMDAWTQPELKSPAQIDKLPGGKEFTARYAVRPETGYTIASVDDKRAAVKVTSIPKSLLDRAVDQA